jgi:transcriptional regulator with XRE-family HTH domain
MSLKPEQCRAARALLNWTQEQLATRARVSPSTVRGFEGGRHDVQRATAAAFRQALEAAGVILLDADAQGGSGARLRPEAEAPSLAASRSPRARRLVFP